MAPFEPSEAGVPTLVGWSAATGNLKAAYVIFGPMRIFGFFLKAVLPNQFARTLVKGGNAAMKKQVSTVYWMVAPCMGGFCLLVAACAGPIISTMYGSQYADGRSVLMLYAVFAFIAFMAQIVGCALRAKQLTKRVFASQAYASLIALPVGWLIIKTLGKIKINATGKIVADGGHGGGGEHVPGPESGGTSVRQRRRLDRVCQVRRQRLEQRRQRAAAAHRLQRPV